MAKATITLTPRKRTILYLFILESFCFIGFKQTAQRLAERFIQDAEKDIEKYIDVKVNLENERIK